MSVWAQSNSDEILLKTGDSLSVVLILDDGIPSSDGVVQYERLSNGRTVRTPMDSVHQITLSDGYELYESDSPLWPQEPEQTATVEQSSQASAPAKSTDQIVFRSGRRVLAILQLDRGIPGPESSLRYVDPSSGDLLTIPMSEVNQLILSDGYVLYDYEPTPGDQPSSPVDPTQGNQQSTAATTDQSTTNTLEEDHTDSESISPNSTGPSEINTISAVDSTDLIILQNGEMIPCQLELDIDPVASGVVRYRPQAGGPIRFVRTRNVQQVALANGYIIFEQSSPSEQQPSMAHLRSSPSNVRSFDCSQAVYDLRKSIEDATDQLIHYMDSIVAVGQARPTNASYAQEQRVRSDIYEELRQPTELLKCQETSVDVLLTIVSDTAQRVTAWEDEVRSYEQLRNYTKIRNEYLQPFLSEYQAPSDDTIFNFSDTIQHFLTSIEDSGIDARCQNELNEIYRDASDALSSYRSMIRPKFTQYQIPIRYSFSARTQKWVYYNGVANIRENGNNVRVTNSNVLREFRMNLPKPKRPNAKYNVRSCYYQIFDDSLRMSVLNVQKKYRYYMHFGANMNFVFPSYTGGSTELVPTEGFLIFHRIGFFGGYGVRLTQRASNETTFPGGFPSLYDDANAQLLGPDTRYFHGGLYIGTFQFTYLKLGYSQLNYQYIYTDRNGFAEDEETGKIRGFLAGLSLIFPVIQLEGGYNLTLQSPYVGGGINIPLNK